MPQKLYNELKKFELAVMLCCPMPNLTLTSAEPNPYTESRNCTPVFSIFITLREL